MSRNPSWFTKQTAKNKGRKGGKLSWLKRINGKTTDEIRLMMSKAGKNRWKNKHKKLSTGGLAI